MLEKATALEVETAPEMRTALGEAPQGDDSRNTHVLSDPHMQAAHRMVAYQDAVGPGMEAHRQAAHNRHSVEDSAQTALDSREVVRDGECDV